MEFLSVFDVLGPKMIGPSSSHTAGAVSIGKMARKMFPEPVRRVRFTLYGSFAQTYRGHGTDKALLGGILGFDTYDMRIRDAFRIAGEQEIAYEYLADTEEVMEHPNRWRFSSGDFRQRDECAGRIYRRRKDKNHQDQRDPGGIHRRVQHADRATV